MWLTGYDAIPAGVDRLPAGGWYAGYVDGLYVSYPLIRRRFPASIVLPVSVWGGVEPIYPALILDVERGNPTPPDQVPRWLAVQRAHGYATGQLGVYADASTWPAIDAALKTAAIDPQSIRRWIADWTFRPHLPQGFHACQWTDHRDIGSPYDQSVCIPEFLSLPQPTPPPPPEDAMAIAVAPNPDDGHLEVFVELASGEIKHIKQDSTKLGWWEKPDGSPNWLSLGNPSK